MFECFYTCHFGYGPTPTNPRALAQNVTIPANWPRCWPMGESWPPPYMPRRPMNFGWPLAIITPTVSPFSQMPLGYPQMPWPQNLTTLKVSAQPPLAFPLMQLTWPTNLALAMTPTLAPTTTCPQMPIASQQMFGVWFANPIVTFVPYPNQVSSWQHMFTICTQPDVNPIAPIMSTFPSFC